LLGKFHGLLAITLAPFPRGGVREDKVLERLGAGEVLLVEELVVRGKAGVLVGGEGADGGAAKGEEGKDFHADASVVAGKDAGQVLV
jgi:hypothetical protein